MLTRRLIEARGRPHSARHHDRKALMQFFIGTSAPPKSAPILMLRVVTLFTQHATCKKCI